MAKGVPGVTWMGEPETGIEPRLSVSQSSSDIKEHQVQGCNNFPNSVFPSPLSPKTRERKLYQGKGSWATIMQGPLPCCPQTGTRPQRNKVPEKLRGKYKEGVRPSPETETTKGLWEQDFRLSLGPEEDLEALSTEKKRILFSNMENKKNYESIK